MIFFFFIIHSVWVQCPATQAKNQTNLLFEHSCATSALLQGTAAPRAGFLHWPRRRRPASGDKRPQPPTAVLTAWCDFHSNNISQQQSIGILKQLWTKIHLLHYHYYTFFSISPQKVMYKHKTENMLFWCFPYFPTILHFLQNLQ